MSAPRVLTGASSGKHLEVEKSVVNELLLVCGVIGSTTTSRKHVGGDKQVESGGVYDNVEDDDGEEKESLVPVADCLLWLQDLQRALRRDDDIHRPIALLVGSWKIVQTKLLPLARSARYDSAMVLTILKILVILTKPLTDNAKRAGRMVIDVKSGKVPFSVIQEQIKLRQNAISQSDVIMDYKHAIVAEHSSTISMRKNRQKKGERKRTKSPTLMSTIVSLLAEPLSKKRKTDADHLVIELVLHLIRNLLCAEPVIKVSRDVREGHTRVHEELISIFHEEMVLDIVLVLGQDVEENKRTDGHYNLLLMEIVHYLLRGQDPSLVAKVGAFRGNMSLMPAVTTSPELSHTALTGGKEMSLRAVLSQEKRKMAASTGIPLTTSRHSHFGGTLMVTKPDGTKQVLSSVLQAAGGSEADQVSEPARKKSKKSVAFISDGRSGSVAGAASMNHVGPMTHRAYRALHGFCTNFVEQCYGPLMKSLKNEFRRDSHRLEDGDKLVFFRMVWFFSQWQRATKAFCKRSNNATTERSSNNEENARRNEGYPSDNCNNDSVGQLVFTMDIFSFKLVLQSCDMYMQHKRNQDLAQAVALYVEMMHLLLAMKTSPDDIERDMSIGLQYALLYADEPLDRLPKLIQHWQPGTFSREYLCHLVELCHLTLKLLDQNTSNDTSKRSLNRLRKGRGKRKAAPGDEDQSEAKDRVAQMTEAAEEYEVKSYFAKLVSNHVVSMYTQLLARYETNAAHINHHVVALFLRMCKFVISRPDEDDEEEEDTGLRGKLVTLEPMLFEVNLLMVLSKILNDSTLAGRGGARGQDHVPLRQFASTIMRHFAKAAERNPLLFVECLFRHPLPHRFCELSSNMYVTDELRMIAVRDMMRNDAREDVTLDTEGKDGENKGEPSVAAAKAGGSHEDGHRGGWEDERMGGNEIHASPTEPREPHCASSGKENGSNHVDGSHDNSECEWEDEASKETRKQISFGRGSIGNEMEMNRKDENTNGKDDDEKTFTKSKASDDNHESENEDDEQLRWSDTRRFVPKRRRLEETSDEDNEEESVSPTSVAVPTAKAGGRGGRIQRKIQEEEESDEEDFGNICTEGIQTQSSRLVFDGDDDDE